MKTCVYMTLALVLLAGTAFAAQVTKVDMTWVNGGTIASIEVQGPYQFVHKTEVPKDGKPDRLIIDVLGATHNWGPKEWKSLPACGVQTVRIGQFSSKPDKVVRVVFDLAKAPLYRVESDGKAIKVYFTDNTVKPFAAWSSGPAPSVPAVVAPVQTTAAQVTTDPRASLAQPVEGPVTKPVEKTAAQLAAATPKVETKPVESFPVVTSPVDHAAMANKPVVATVEVSKPVVANPQPVQKPTEKTATVTVSKPVVAQATPPVTKSAPTVAVTTTATKAPETKPSTTVASTVTAKPTATAVATAPVTKPTVSAPTVKAEVKPSVSTGTSVAVKTPATTPTVESKVTNPLATKPNPTTVTTAQPDVKQTPTPIVAPNAPKPEQLAKAANFKVNPPPTSDQPATGSPSATAASSVTPTKSATTVATTEKPSVSTTPVTKDAAPTPANEDGETVVTAGGEKPSTPVAGSPLLADVGTPTDGSVAGSVRPTARFRRNANNKMKSSLVAEFPQRLVVKYESSGYRDPFATLIDDTRTYDTPLEQRIPNVDGLKLVGVIESPEGVENRALFEDKHHFSYILKSGDKVQKGYVLRVENDKVYFQIFEYGWSRTIALTLENRE